MNNIVQDFPVDPVIVDGSFHVRCLSLILKLYDVNVDVGFLSKSHFDQLANLTNIDQIIL